MSRIPRPLARKLDRLARKAHAFHRYAHHPLCGEYADEVIRVGKRTRICRGCAMTALGAFAGAAVGLAFAPGLFESATALGLAALLALVRTRRGAKIPTRFLPAMLLALAFASGIRSGTWGGGLLAVTVLAVAGLLFLAYRGRGPERSPCARCPERLSTEPCRGFAAIVRRERAVQRFSRARLAQV